MIQLEIPTNNRHRSLSFSYTGKSSLLKTPLHGRLPDAEHIRCSNRKSNGSGSVDERYSNGGGYSDSDSEDEEETWEFLRPLLPIPSTKEEVAKVDALAKLTTKYRLNGEHLRLIEKRMLDEVNRGLAKQTNAGASVKAFVTYVHELPTGREEGKYLALDLGGTNFRVILIELEAGSRSVKMKSHKKEVSQKLMLGPGEALFDFIAETLYHFMVEHNLLGRRYNLGFTFSFPMKQKSLASAELANWTKGFVCSGVVNNDVVQLLETAIAKRPEMEIAVDAILNDTTGCLLACAYKRPESRIGVILGTGSNAAYLEEMQNCEVYEGDCPTEVFPHVVINTEWGAYGQGGSLEFIRTRYDHDMDDASLNPGKQIYEKLMSGMYLGELTRHTIVHAMETGILFNGKIQKVLLEKGSFPTRFLSEIEDFVTRDDISSVKAVLKEIGIPTNEYSNFDCKILRYICEAVSCRAAGIAGAGVASLVNKVGRRRITVGVDGSLYKFHPHFGQRMRAAMRKLVSEDIQFEVVLSEDGSGRGAALAAAMAQRQKKKLDKLKH